MIKKTLLTMSSVLALLINQAHAGPTRIQFEEDESHTGRRNTIHFKEYDGTEQKGFLGNVSPKSLASYAMYAVSSEESYQKNFPDLSFGILQHILSENDTWDTIVGKTIPYNTPGYEGFLQIRGLSFVNKDKFNKEAITYNNIKNLISQNTKEFDVDFLSILLKTLKEKDQDTLLTRTNVHKEGDKTAIHYYLYHGDEVVILTAMRNKSQLFPELTGVTMRLANFSLIDTDPDTAQILPSVSQEMVEEDNVSVASYENRASVEDVESEEGDHEEDLVSDARIFLTVNHGETQDYDEVEENDEEEVSYEALRSLWRKTEEIGVETHINSIESLNFLAVNDVSDVLDSETTADIEQLEPSQQVESHINDELIQEEISNNTAEFSLFSSSEESSMHLNLTDIPLDSSLVWQDQELSLAPATEEKTEIEPTGIEFIHDAIMQDTFMVKGDPLVSPKPVTYTINETVKNPAKVITSSKKQESKKPLQMKAGAKKKPVLIKKKIIKKNALEKRRIPSRKVNVKKVLTQKLKTNKKVLHKEKLVKNTRAVNKHIIKAKNVSRIVKEKRKFIANGYKKSIKNVRTKSHLSHRSIKVRN